MIRAVEPTKVVFEIIMNDLFYLLFVDMVSLAKSQIARRSGLSAQTVSVIMRSLENDGLLLKGQAPAWSSWPTLYSNEPKSKRCIFVWVENWSQEC